MHASPNLESALQLAKAGIAIFPCGPDKRPLVKWRALSSTAPEAVEAWWQQHPGAVPAIDLGKSGLVVLDGDRHGGPDGRAALRDLLDTQDDFDRRMAPAVVTPADGLHVYFNPNGHALTNTRGDLPAGIDVRGAGGYVVAPNAVLPDGRRYSPIRGAPDLTAVYPAGAVPHIPEGVAALLLARKRAKDKPRGERQQDSGDAGIRERCYAEAALAGCAAELSAAARGGRNELANKIAFRLGRMIARGWLDRLEAEAALLDAMRANGYVDEDGIQSAEATLRSGLDAGEQEPHPDLADQWSAPEGAPGDVRLEHFVAYMPQHNYFFKPTREPWPASSVNSRLPPVPTTANDRLKLVSASAWLDQNSAVEQMVWVPGMPMLIPDQLFSDGGWFSHDGVTCFNLYRPPSIVQGNAISVDPWLDHLHRIYPDEARHILFWLAHRVQRPAEKVNHALVLAGAQGIGKDTLIEPIKHAVGPWNFQEVSPINVMGRFNGFLRSVVLRVSEARDMGEVNRYQFYDHMKSYLAAPPDVLRVDEKNLREYSILNCCGVILTSNYKSDGIYLPADDRRHFVAWSECTQSDFSEGYWSSLWHWYARGGFGNVAAYLSELDITAFDPKAPPPKTPAFWAIVDASRAPEEAEIADVLDLMGNPPAITLAQITAKASGEFEVWIRDRKNRRSIPHRLEKCGLIPFRNDTAQSGLWRISGIRQVIYVQASLQPVERLRAARKLAGEGTGDGR